MAIAGAEGVIRHISYKAGFKYQLTETYVIQTQIRPTVDINTEYIDMSTSGLLIIRKGYAWDGTSGPTRDGKTNQRGSLVHDALYQLFREGLLSRIWWRESADQLFIKICKEDKMCWVRRKVDYIGLRLFAKGATKHKAMKEVMIAP